MSQLLFSALVVAVALERVAELLLARRNAAWSLARGGYELGASHYPLMVMLHTALLLGALVEVWGAGREFVPWLGWLCVGGVLLAQGLRWWCISSLGSRWNTRVIVVPGLPLVSGGPYRWLRHPNYWAVLLEGAALPLVHSAWWTAALFFALNLPLLAVRVRCEERALEGATTAGAEIGA